MYIEKRIRKPEAVFDLLAKCGLTFNGAGEYTVGIYEGDKLVATGALANAIAQMIAVDPDYQGENLAAKVVTNLLNYAFQERISPVYLFTSPNKGDMFTSLGFREVATAQPYASLLEFGGPGIAEYCARLRETTTLAGDGDTAALVMNCNPFTLGHRCLVETAAARSGGVCLFVVEEDRSEFPFADRIGLVREGTADIPNVTVVPGGRYIISSMTFPSYFTKDSLVAKAHASLDAAIFVRHIAPALGIARRYVGTEPFSPVTNIYNESLLEILPPGGVEVVEIPRKRRGDREISASEVRARLVEGDLASVEGLVPPTTFAYLSSAPGRAVIERLKGL